MRNTTPTDAHISNLPRQYSALVGRETELAQICQQLLNPACRLLTLLGPGGMGKTRLAIEVATGLQDEFAASVHFVNLQPLSDPAQLPTALADALHFPLSGSDPVESQLLRYLANKEMLLLLDNFEHLLVGVDFLSELLLQSPGVKALITSREVLNLQEEWLFPLTGLAFPPIGFAPESLEQYAAANLFVERMRRLRPQFILAEEAEAISRICRLVEGMPLPLELAASWTKTLTCAEIAAEIERGIAFLTTGLRNTPERHRSMLAVFAQSWRQLNEAEQMIFARLSVFHGGFRREAAEQVVGASLIYLSGFVDKSLLRWEQGSAGGGRYQVHELLRQYAQEELAQRTTETDATHTKHAAYYLRFLRERLPAMLGGRQREAIAEINSDLDNFRAAWAWAVKQGDVAALGSAAPTLSHFYHMHSRYQEGVALFTEALGAIDQMPLSDARQQAWASISALLGWLYIRNTQFAEAEALLQQSVAVHRQSNHSPALGFGTDPRLALSILALLNGQYAQAAQLGEEARAISQRDQQPWNEIFAWNLLGFAQMGSGDLALAQQSTQRSIALAEQHGDRWFVAYLFKLAGNIAMIRQDTVTALRYYEKSYLHHQEFDDQEGMAGTLNNWGDIELEQGQRAAAQSRFQQALKHYQTYQDKGGLNSTFTRLGYVALLDKDFELARRYLHQALELATQHEVNILTLMTLGRVGELLLQVNAIAQSISAFTYICHHPATDPHTHQLMQALLDKAQAATTPSHFQSLYAGCSHTSFEELSALLLQTLSAPFLAPAADLVEKKDATSEDASSRANAMLIEPLTERELEILHLIADGHTNHAIADKLILSPGTVKWYSSEIYGKLGVSNRTQAVAEARRLKLIS